MGGNGGPTRGAPDGPAKAGASSAFQDLMNAHGRWAGTIDSLRTELAEVEKAKDTQIMELMTHLSRVDAKLAAELEKEAQIGESLAPASTRRTSKAALARPDSPPTKAKTNSEDGLGPATSSRASLGCIYSAPSSSDVPAPALTRINSEPNRLLDYQHFDAFSRSWAKGLPRAGSTSPRVQQLHREMLDVFEQAVEDNLIVQVPAVSPGCRRYSVSPEPPHKSAQKLHRENLAEFERGVQDGLLVQVHPTRSNTASPDPSREPVKRRLGLVTTKNAAQGGHASRDESLVAAAATTGRDQPAAPGTVLLWFREFKRRFIERLERNDGPLLFIDGFFVFLLICVYCHLFM